MGSSMVAGSMNCGRAIDGQDRRDTGEKEGQIRAQARARLEIRNSSSWDEGRRQAGLSRTQRGKSYRRVIAMSANCARTVCRPTVATPDVEHHEDDLGPTLLQILSAPAYEVTTDLHTRLRHQKTRHGSPLVAAALGRPLCGLGKASLAPIFLRHLQG